MPEEPPAKGMGLRIMNHRAEMIGASFEVYRHPEGGAVVQCRVKEPVRKETVHGEVEE